jgi:hypothetical protein
MLCDVLIIFVKESQEIIADKLTLGLFLGVGLILGAWLPLDILLSRMVYAQDAQTVLDTYSGILFLSITLGLAWGPSGWIFMREKAEKTFESLLATPLTLQVIWLGKAAVVSAWAYGYSCICAIILLVRFNLATNGAAWTVLPSSLGWWNLIVVTPLFVFVAVALSGLVQMLLAHPRIGNYVTMAIIFLLLKAGKDLIIAVNLRAVAVYTLVAVMSCAAILIVSRWLRKERIVLSLE